MNRQARSWARPILGVVGLLVAYYAFPVDLGASVFPVVLGMGLTVAGLVLLGTMLVQELQQVLRGQDGRSSRVLSMMLVLLVMSFSLAFFLLNLLWPHQVAGLETRTDALYFTLSTMTTVGFGDVHAQGQVARALVCGLIVFNIVVVASLVRVQTTRRGGSGARATEGQR
jgi:voltage-gated potassium channel